MEPKTQAQTARQARHPQPLHVSQLDEALLTLKTASATAGLSQATLYRMAAAGRLKLVKMGARCTRIRAADLRAFIASLG